MKDRQPFMNNIAQIMLKAVQDIFSTQRAR